MLDAQRGIDIQTQPLQQSPQPSSNQLILLLLLLLLIIIGNEDSTTEPWIGQRGVGRSKRNRDGKTIPRLRSGPHKVSIRIDTCV